MPDIFTTKKNNLPETSKSTEKALTSAPSQETPVQKSEKKTDPNNSIGLFTTFLKNPGGISFSQQDTDEKIILFLRRDFGTNSPWIAATIFLIIIPPILRFIFSATGISLPFLPTNFIRLFIIFYYFVVAGFAFSNYLTWFFTLGLVTTKRAVDIDFVNVSSIKYSAADLPDIIDAKYSQNGFSQSFFDYGDVSIAIQTPQEKILFEQAPRPSEVVNIIDDLIGPKE